MLKDKLRYTTVLKSVFEHTSIQTERSAPRKVVCSALPPGAGGEAFTRQRQKQSQQII